MTADWIDELSIDRYRPMQRLLDTAELDFLRAQPGFNPQMESRLRYSVAGYSGGICGI